MLLLLQIDKKQHTIASLTAVDAEALLVYSNRKKKKKKANDERTRRLAIHSYFEGPLGFFHPLMDVIHAIHNGKRREKEADIE